MVVRSKLVLVDGALGPNSQHALTAKTRVPQDTEREYVLVALLVAFMAHGYDAWSNQHGEKGSGKNQVVRHRVNLLGMP
jgi:hypothetical protein